MHKQEALDVLEAYRRNTEHVLGENDEQTKAIKTCINLVDELEYDNSYWENIEVNVNDPIETWQIAKCHKCGLYLVTPYKCAITLYDFCPYCGADMRSKSKSK